VPRLIPAETDARIELGDLVEMLEAGPFDPDDENVFASYGPALKMLANNRQFLGDFVIAELKRSRGEGFAPNQYGPQVIMLHAASKRFLIRANFWPAAGDSVVVNSGTAPFFYGLAHDHNFSFLTAGYLGPGYLSDYYEYDYGAVAGYAGEKVGLRFAGRSRLEQGMVMLYRAHRDVHLQLPADAMSVSLNVLGLSPGHEFRDQYRFDVARSEVAGILSSTALDPLIALAPHLGGEEGRELVETFAARHPSDRVRFAAVKAKAAAAGGPGERIAVFEQAARAPNLFVSAMARREAKRIAAARGWFETVPPS
jgi:hypothetical protein